MSRDKALLRTGSLCSPDPYVQLLTALKKDDLNTFQEIFRTIDDLETNQWYDEEDGTLLDLALRQRTDIEFVKILLDNGANPNLINKSYKKYPIHFAVESGNDSYIDLLINKKVDVNVTDKTLSTPLHLAAKLKHNNCLKLLINHKNINVNLINKKNETPIHIAARNKNKEAVYYLLNVKNIDIDTVIDTEGKSARQLISERFPELIDNFSTVKSTVDINWDNITVNDLCYWLQNREISNFLKGVRSRIDLIDETIGCETFLQFVCRHGLSNVVDELITLGADPNKTSEDARTPIMIASYKGYINIVKLLIVKCGRKLKFEPINGETVLHSVINGITVLKEDRSEEQLINYYECFKVLLENVPRSQLEINSGDVKGNTALHYAAKLGNEKFILLLLENGAYVGKRNILHEPALADINPKILETYLDNCITTNNLLPREDNYEIIFRYNFLAPIKKIKSRNSTWSAPKFENSPSSSTPLQNKNDFDNDDEIFNDKTIPETEPLFYMSRSSDLRHLLKHPVLTSFLYLKWHRIRCLFYCNLIFYLIFWMLLTSYILMAYLTINKPVVNDMNSNKTNNNSNNIELNDEIINDNKSMILRILVGFFLILLVARELFQLLVSPLRYFTNPENWLEIGLIGITISILFCQFCVNLRHPVSAIAILLSWSELVLLIGRHPALSTNIEMFKTVTWNFLKFLAWYSILIIAFALSFYTLFCDSEKGDDENYFVDPAMSVFKTVVMLTGEFDAGSIPFVSYPGTSHILFVLFVFLIAIVLFNLLNGLAVSDTQLIKADAELVGYVSRVKLIVYFETMAMGNSVPYDGFLSNIRQLFCCIPEVDCTVTYSCLTLFSKKINLFPDLYPNCKIRILPNKESRIEMYHHGLKRKERDIEADNDDFCNNICNNMSMDPDVVRAAKLILVKKSEEQSCNGINKMCLNCKDQLDQYKKQLDLFAKQTEEKLNKLLSYFDQKKIMITDY